MSEEQEKEQEEKQQLEQQEEIVDEVKQDEVVQDEPQDVQNVAEAPADEKKDTQAEEAASEVSEEVLAQQESKADKKDDTEVVEEPEVKPDEVSEPSEEITEVEEPVPARDEELEKAKAELAEKEAELAEEKAIKSYEDDVREANRQYDEFLTNLGNAMLQELNKYGIDANTSIEELRKTDPAKAQVAENIVRQAQQAKEIAQRNVQNNLNDRLTDVVFGKASRLFDKYELTNEQGEVAAETFVNIMAQSGIRDMGDDLIAKVELAVARAKMLKPKVEKVIDDTKAVVKEAKEAVVDVINAKAPVEAKAPEKAETPEEIEEAPKEETEEKKEEAPKVESVVETPSIEEFKESAVTSTQQTGSPLNEDNVLDEMARLSYKDRVTFYAKNKAMVDKAMAKKANAERKRI